MLSGDSHADSTSKILQRNSSCFNPQSTSYGPQSSLFSPSGRPSVSETARFVSDNMPGGNRQRNNERWADSALSEILLRDRPNGSGCAYCCGWERAGGSEWENPTVNSRLEGPFAYSASLPVDCQDPSSSKRDGLIVCQRKRKERNEKRNEKTFVSTQARRNDTRKPDVNPEQTRWKSNGGMGQAYLDLLVAQGASMARMQKGCCSIARPLRSWPGLSRRTPTPSFPSAGEQQKPPRAFPSPFHYKMAPSPSPVSSLIPIPVPVSFPFPFPFQLLLLVSSRYCSIKVSLACLPRHNSSHLTAQCDDAYIEI